MARDGLRAAAVGGADLFVVGSVSDLTQGEAIRGAKRMSKPPTVVALVGQASRAEVGRLLGADALLERAVPAEELGDALRRLAAGERVQRGRRPRRRARPPAMSAPLVTSRSTGVRARSDRTS
jgi:hypothetical protein